MTRNLITILILLMLASPALALETEFGGRGSHGNGDAWTLVAKGSHVWGDNVSLSGEYITGKALGEIVEDRASAELYYDQDLSRRTYLWFYDQFTRDWVFGLRENRAGGGPGLVLYRTPSAKIKASTGLVHQLREWDDGRRDSLTLTSWRVKAAHESNGRTIEGVGLYQVVAGDARDYLASGTLSYTIKWDKNDSWRVSFVNEFRSVVPDDQPGHTQTWWFSFVHDWSD